MANVAISQQSSILINSLDDSSPMEVSSVNQAVNAVVQEPLTLLNALKKCWYPKDREDRHWDVALAKKGVLNVTGLPSDEEWVAIAKAISLVAVPINDLTLENLPANRVDFFVNAISVAYDASIQVDLTVSSAILLTQTIITANKLVHLQLVNKGHPLRNEGMVALSNLLRSRSLAVLNIYRGEIKLEAAISLQFGLTFNTFLINLVLDNCKIDDQSVLRVCEGLSKNKSVRVLSLSCNPLGNQGLMHLANLLKMSKALENLYLNDVATQEEKDKEVSLDEGILALAKGIRENADSQLSVLSLYNNKITKVGFKGLAHLIRETRTLTSFFMNSDLIGKEGVADFSEALSSNRSLRVVEFNVEMDKEDRKKLREAVSRNQTLYSLETPENEEGVLFEETGSILTPLYLEKLKVRMHVIASFITLAFVKANKNHHLRYSILPLLALIVENLINEFEQYSFVEESYDEWCERDKKNLRIIQGFCDRFIGSRYFHNELNPAPVNSRNDQDMTKILGKRKDPIPI